MRHPRSTAATRSDSVAFKQSYAVADVSAQAARHELVDALRKAGADRGLVDDVGLCVTELAANAVRHAQLPAAPPEEPVFVVTAYLLRRFGEPLLRVEVHDCDGAHPPCFPPPDAPFDTEAVSGRGLQMIGLLSANHGYAASMGGWKSVWAEFPPDGLTDDDEPAIRMQACAAALMEL